MKFIRPEGMTDHEYAVLSAVVCAGCSSRGIAAVGRSGRGYTYVCNRCGVSKTVNISNPGNEYSDDNSDDFIIKENGPNDGSLPVMPNGNCCCHIEMGSSSDYEEDVSEDEYFSDDISEAIWQIKRDIVDEITSKKLSRLKKADLQDAAEILGICKDGTKAQIINRIISKVAGE